MVSPSLSYEPRAPERNVLYEVVRDHLETFLAQAAHLREGEGVPRFVEQEFRDFLRCGWLAGGFARFQCRACGTDRLIPFSCKGRSFCPSCGGRRMTERAAHLVDHVFPNVPVRQWVLSLPHRVRYLLAWDHNLCRAVVAVYLRAVLGFLRRRARRAGVTDGRGGAVAIIQRFGAALNLNIHVHALVLDGVFAADASDTLRFHRTPALTRDEMAALVATIERRIMRLLGRRGLASSDDDGGVEDRWTEEAPTLAGIGAAAIEGRAALGPRAGARTRRCGDPPEAVEARQTGPCGARLRGFDLHAGLFIPVGQRDRLERVCRYALRPPVASDRLHRAETGQVWLELRHRWSDGTTHLVFDPVELLERLAAITPRPRINLVLYYGLLAPRSAWRARVVPSTEDRDATDDSRHGSGPLWADLMQRSFGFDPLVCPWCGGRMRLIALIDQPPVIRRILSYLGLPTEIPEPRPAHAQRWFHGSHARSRDPVRRRRVIAGLRAPLRPPCVCPGYPLRPPRLGTLAGAGIIGAQRQ